MHSNIHDLVIYNYQNNIKYLQSHYHDIYNQILTLENNIDTQRYQERFELTLEQGGLDIFDKTTNNYIYLQQSDKIKEIITQSINTKKDENLFETFKIPQNPPVGYQKILDIYQHYTKKTYSMKKIQKFVFFGVGLHVESIHNQIGAKTYLFIEENLELFRLSLFTTPYFAIADDAQLFFSIAQERKSFTQTVQNFLEEQFYYNQYIKFFHALHHSEEKLQQMHTQIVSASHLNFFYSSMLVQYMRSVYYLQQNYNFLNLLDPKLHNALSDKPTLLLAPGPSLTKNITWLQQHQNNFLIVALSATLPLLYEAQIKPDIITHFDGFERSEIHFHNVKDLTYFQNAIALFSTKTPLNIVNMFDKERIFFFESSTNFKKDFGSISAFCAGSSTYLILLALKIKEIYLLGLDLAVDQKTLQTHATNYHYNLIGTTQENTTRDFRSSLIERRGNFTNNIKTTPNFAISIDAINTISLNLKTPQQHIYNLSDGAFLERTKPYHTNAISLQNLNKADIFSLFKQSAQSTLQEEEKSSLKAFHNHATQILQNLHNYKNKNIKTPQQLLDTLIDLENTICSCEESSCELISDIYVNYTHFIYPYIFDLFNTEEIQLDDTIEDIYIDVLNTLKSIATELQQKSKV